MSICMHVSAQPNLCVWLSIGVRWPHNTHSGCAKLTLILLIYVECKRHGETGTDREKGGLWLNVIGRSSSAVTCRDGHRLRSVPLFKADMIAIDCSSIRQLLKKWHFTIHEDDQRVSSAHPEFFQKADRRGCDAPWLKRQRLFKRLCRNFSEADFEVERSFGLKRRLYDGNLTTEHIE